jgi:uncharacterized protein (DUF433 family)
MTRLPDTAGKGRESALPSIADIASEIREGSTVEAVCAKYHIARSTLQNRFKLAGYTLSTGQKHEQPHNRPAPLESQHVGAGGQHVGGGDYQGLPTTPVRHRGRRQGSSIDWDQITENYIARGGQVDASVWPKHGKVVVIEGGARSSSASMHSFVEADDSEYTEPATRTRRPKPAPTSTPRVIKVPAEQRAEIGRRYAAGESTQALARAYGVSEGSIRYAIKKADVPMRSSKEAAALLRERNAT